MILPYHLSQALGRSRSASGRGASLARSLSKQVGHAVLYKKGASRGYPRGPFSIHGSQRLQVPLTPKEVMLVLIPVRPSAFIMGILIAIFGEQAGLFQARYSTPPGLPASTAEPP